MPSSTPLRIESIRLDDVILQSLQLFELKFAEKELRVERDLAAAAVTIRADLGKLRQVLVNLLENAWRYSPPQGELRIIVRKQPMALEICLTNSSTAPLAGNEERLFERFHRASGAKFEEQGASGLGLAIVKEIVESHGGAVGSRVAAGEVSVWFTWPM